MNQYQIEVELLDNKRRQLVRAATFVGAAILAIVVLWSAGVPMTGWFSSARQWFASTTQKSPQTVQLPIPTAFPTNAAPTSREVPSSALAGTDSSLSKVPLALLLMRTAPGRNNHEGTAAIGVARENPQTYNAGALLENGAKLSEIYKDYVVLERNGRTTRLYIDPKKNSTSELSMVGGPQDVTPVVATSSEALTDYLRPSPLYDGQTLRGYQVYAGQRLAVFFQLGLQDGDVITSLNNAPLSDPTEAIERFRRLLSGAAMVATIERKGEVKTVSLDGSIIVADLAHSRDAASAQPMAPAGM